MTEPRKPALQAAYALQGREDALALYRDWAESYDQSFAGARGYRTARLVAAEYVAAGGGWPVLDAGCGTGLIADDLPAGAVVDGYDFSPEMLAAAASKGRYRVLREVDLTRPIEEADGVYAGLVSAGIFTHGHVGPEALVELLRLMAPGALCVVGVNAEYAAGSGFRAVLDGLEAEGRITAPVIREERIYAKDAVERDEHSDDMGLIVRFGVAEER